MPDLASTPSSPIDFAAEWKFINRLINFHSAAKSMGELGVEAKSGTHNLWEGDAVPDPSDYVTIDRSNVKWSH